MKQTLGQLYEETRRRLAPVTISSAQAAAETDWLFEVLLGIPSRQVLSDAERPILAQDMEKIHHMLDQRVEKRIPIQYLLHEAWFFGLKFYVNPHVLIPRPETELLVEEALKLTQPGMRVLDVGTGPGTIAVTLSHRLGDSAAVTGVDVSEAALKVARLNQKRHGTSVLFESAGDLFEPVSGKRFDIIVSNPPYVDPASQNTLSPEVLWHEPGLALFSPEADAIHFYRRLATEGKAYLQPGGTLLLELGAGMGSAVGAVLQQAGFEDIRVIPDYAGHERIAVGVLNS